MEQKEEIVGDRIEKCIGMEICDEMRSSVGTEWWRIRESSEKCRTGDQESVQRSEKGNRKAESIKAGW